jgi:hypothetical protein
VRRNHIEWLDFLCRAAQSWREWLPAGELRAQHEARALASWFDRAA